jgi:hypothetical protein
MLRLKVEEAYQNVAGVPRSRGFVDHGRGGAAAATADSQSAKENKELSRKGCRSGFQCLSSFKQKRISRSRRNSGDGEG